MIPFFLFATFLFLPLVDGYYMYVHNDCPEGSIYVSAAYFSAFDGEGYCYENIRIPYDDGEFLLESSTRLSQTHLPIFFTYAESVSGAFRWDGTQFSDDETVEAACGSNSPVKMIPWTLVITAAELDYAVDQDVLVAFHSCDGYRNLQEKDAAIVATEEEDEEDCVGTWTHNGKIGGCISGKLPANENDFILQHMNMSPLNCGKGEDDEPCDPKDLHDMHRFRRFLQTKIHA